MTATASDLPADLATFWAKAESSTYDGKLPTKGTSLLDLPKLLSPDYLEPTLTHVSDALPKGRAKLIHPYGLVTVFRFVPCRDDQKKTTATGLLADEQLLLGRLSIADPNPAHPFAPGLALKFLIDKSPSRNIIGVVSLEGTRGPPRFFAHPLTTNVPPPDALPFELVNRSAQATVDRVCPRGKKNSLVYPLDALCQTRPNGDRVSSGDARTPDWIEFWPTGEGRKLYAKGNPDNEDFRVRFKRFTPGTHVFRIWGALNGEKTANAPVGDLYIERTPIACTYGDTELFFQHEYADAP